MRIESAYRILDRVTSARKFMLTGVAIWGLLAVGLCWTWAGLGLLQRAGVEAACSPAMAELRSWMLFDAGVLALLWGVPNAVATAGLLCFETALRTKVKQEGYPSAPWP